MIYDHKQLPRAYGKPEISARIRVQPEDFQVDEVAGFDADGEGEHALLHIRKRNQNSAAVARELAQLAEVREMDVGYAGLKDRVAVTTQWFTVHLPGRDDPDWSQLESDQLEIIQVTRHRHKLKRGELEGNEFNLVLRELQGDRAALLKRMQRVAAEGVPNYFGVQRFGREQGNLAKAAEMFERKRRVNNRQLRGLYLSAARSMLFNLVLAERVAAGNWNQLLPGEAIVLDGSNTNFFAGALKDELQPRLDRFDIHPSAPLWGRGQLRSKREALALEQGVVAELKSWCSGLEHAGLKQERRATRLLPGDMAWSLLDEQTLKLSFFLPPGCYATTVLSELVEIVAESGEG